MSNLLDVLYLLLSVVTEVDESIKLKREKEGGRGVIGYNNR